MKTVYNSEMVCHLWANRHATDVRTPTKNLYTESGALFSYGSHFVIGAFLDKPKSGAAFILWNDAQTSATTNKHRHKARYSLSAENRAALVASPVQINWQTIRDYSGLVSLARDIVREARGPLEKCETARGRFPEHIATARRYFDAARRLFIYAGDKRGAASVPTIEESPTKETARQILKTIARVEYLKNAAEHSARALRELSAAQTLAVDYLLGEKSYYPGARAIVKHAETVIVQTEAARGFYKKAGARVPAALTENDKKARAIIAEFSSAAHDESIRETRADVMDRLNRLRLELARYNRAKNSAEHFGRAEHALAFAAGRLSDTIGRAWYAAESLAAEIIPAEETRAEITRKIERAQKILNCNYFESAAARLSDEIENAETLAARGFNAPSAQDVINRARMENMPEFYKKQAAEILPRVEAARAKHAEIVRQQNAEKIEQWRNGARVSIPYGVPTMARIVGDTVETSRGAVVPLLHAVRLVKLARKVAQSGGARFDSGNGPIVGHFRVNAINADFSAVIGCHEFSAEESARIMAEIEKRAETIEA